MDKIRFGGMGGQKTSKNVGHHYWMFPYEKIMRFKVSPQLPGAERTRAWHQNGSHTPTSPGAILLVKWPVTPNIPTASVEYKKDVTNFGQNTVDSCHSDQ